MGSINLSTTYLQSVFSSGVQDTSAPTGTTGGGPSTVGVVSTELPPDNSQLSPFAQVISILQQLQQSDPSQYQQITQQIVTNLQKAAQTAQSDGNTTAANQLNQLAADFTTASKSGQFPNVQNLAQAVHHHHRLASVIKTLSA